jgi:Flp pilus assembly protein CpaB
VLLAGMAKGEVVTTSRLAPKGGPVAALVPSGLRAVTVPSTFAPGAIRAGDHVDVLATFPGARAHVETVATGLEVLAVVPSSSGASGSNQGGASDAGADLLVLVEPSQAQQLAYAKAFAAVSIALDGPEGVVAGS